MEHKRLNFRQADSVRTHIKAIKLVQAMQDHALGKRDMSGTQIQAGSFLLSKVLPNPPEERKVTGEMTINWPLPRTKLDD